MSKSIKKYQQAMVGVDVVIFTVAENKLKVLLIKMKKAPFIDRWAMPGGLIGINESVDEAALRNLKSKTGVKEVFLEQLYTFGEVNRDPFGRVISVAYFALIPSLGLKLKTTAEYGDVRWFDLESLPKLAYDHKKMLHYAVARLQAKLAYTNIVCNLLPIEFTLGELQEIYEVILARKIDKRNFRKKINHLQVVKKTGKQRSGQASRPADLYSFIDKKEKIIQIL